MTGGFPLLDNAAKTPKKGPRKDPFCLFFYCKGLLKPRSFPSRPINLSPKALDQCELIPSLTLRDLPAQGNPVCHPRLEVLEGHSAKAPGLKLQFKPGLSSALDFSCFFGALGVLCLDFLMFQTTSWVLFGVAGFLLFKPHRYVSPHR